MEMKYNSDYWSETRNVLTQYLTDTKKFKEFSIKIDSEFNNPPVILICRTMQEGMGYADQLLLTKHCILNKIVKFMLDDKEIGSMLLTQIKDDNDFEIFPVFKEYPMALTCLIDTCVGFVSSKYLPPLKDTKNQTTGAKV